MPPSYGNQTNHFHHYQQPRPPLHHQSQQQQPYYHHHQSNHSSPQPSSEMQSPRDQEHQQNYQQPILTPTGDENPSNTVQSDYYVSGDETPHTMTGSDSPVYERAESHRSTPETLVALPPSSSSSTDPTPTAPLPVTETQPSSSSLETKDHPVSARVAELQVVVESLLAKRSSSAEESSKEESLLSVSSIKWDDIRDIYESNLPSFTFKEGFINKYSCITLCSYTAQLVKCFPGPIFGNYTKQAQLILPIFAIACGPFKDAEMTLNKGYTNSKLKLQGKFDLFIKKGNKRFGVIHAKMGQLEQAMTECILGMEAVSDSDQVQNVYGVVTDYIYWFFLERRHDVVRRHISTLALNGDVPLDTSLLSIASTIVSLLSDGR
jgi:hypothetical protein